MLRLGIALGALLVTACQVDGRRDVETPSGEEPAPPNVPPSEEPAEPDPEMPVEPDPEDPTPALRCVDGGATAALLDASDREVASYDSLAECEEVLDAAGEGVVCDWFTPGMNIGPGAWDETGWRPMNIETGMGLGRVPHESFEDCLAATRNARGGVVCTNTAVGYKSAHIGTNTWCGASSNLPYCLEASLAARNFFVCSFPSDGDGSGPGWVLTEIAGSACDYLTSSMPLTECNALVPIE